MSASEEKLQGRGLDAVIAVHTGLSRIDGEQGTLVIRGHWVEQLAFEHTFESVCHLLWHGALPDSQAMASLRSELGGRRHAAYERLVDQPASAMRDPMDALRAALACLESTGDLMNDALNVVAAVPVANALWWGRKNGRGTPVPREASSTAEDYLRMITRQDAPAALARALDRYLVTVSDHGMNASTFTARVIASTRSDLISAVVGAVGALKGPLHGGAPGPVLDMLDAIGAPERAGPWLESELAAGRRIMGMGHRVYRVRDPRAAVFERALAELARDGGHDRQRLALAQAVERTAETVLAAKYPTRDLKANVEFYTAVLLEAVGVPRTLFSPTFAVGRAAGWVAHVLEQRAEDKLIRPRSRYVGPLPE